MRNNKTMACVFALFFSGVIFLLLHLMSKNPLLVEMTAVEETATHVDIASSNGLYFNYHKKFGTSFVKTIFESIEIKKIDEASCGILGRKSREEEWLVYFDFYRSDSRIFRVILNAEAGKLLVVGKKRWYAYLTAKSKSELTKLLAQVGLTTDLGHLPLADNVSATTNAVFRKESSVPYSMNNVVFIMPNEHFRVGVIVSDNAGGIIYCPKDYNIYYRKDQKYDNSLDINFHVDKSSPSNEKQVLLNIRNNCSFGIQFSLYYLIKDELDYIVGGYEIQKNKTLSIKADPNVDCYILGLISKRSKGSIP